GYPAPRADRELLWGEERYALRPQLPVCLPAARLLALQSRVRDVHASSALLDYVQAWLHFSRESPLYQNGLSPRAGLALL
ncbi:AAA family ATPase, partial [Methylococcus sp. S1B]